MVRLLSGGSMTNSDELWRERYAAVRTSALAALSFIAIFGGSNTALLTLGTLAGIIQLGDAAVGLLQHGIGKTVGPLVIAILQFVALLSLKRAVDARK
jgi:hypothetical protein